MKTVLITGFEPFGGESVNPSWEVVSGLDNVIIDGCRLVARQLPCVFGESLDVLNAAIDALSPSLVLAVGQAGGRTDITVERVAINVDDARIADNQGQQPVDEPIVDGAAHPKRSAYADIMIHRKTDHNICKTISILMPHML